MPKKTIASARRRRAPVVAYMAHPGTMKSGRTWRVLIVGEDPHLRRQVRESLRQPAGWVTSSSGRSARAGQCAPPHRVVEAPDAAGAVQLLHTAAAQGEEITALLVVIAPGARQQGQKLARQLSELAPDWPMILSVPPEDAAWWEREAQRLHPWLVSVLVHPPEPLALRALIRLHASRGAGPGVRPFPRFAVSQPQPATAALSPDPAASPLLLRMVEGLVSGLCQWQAEQVPEPAEGQMDAENLAAWRYCRRVGAVHRATALAAQLALADPSWPTRPEGGTHLEPIVEEVVAHLRRLLGDMVEVERGETAGAGRVAADPTALHRVLFDLALLALPPFPRGARLKFRCETLPPGKDSRGAAAPGEIRVLLEAHPPPEDARPCPAPPGAGSPFLTGLEWNTAQTVMKRLGGQLSRLRLSGGQTGFEIRLPAWAPAGDSANLAPGPAPGGGFDAGAAPAEPPPGATVLLVDDDESVRATTRLFLEEYDCRILEAIDSTSALRLWQEVGRNVYLLVVDLVIPGEVDGLQLARRLQAERPGLRTLLTTGYAGPGLIEELKSMPDTEFLPKPYTYAQMHAVLRRHLRPRAAPA